MEHNNLFFEKAKVNLLIFKVSLMKGGERMDIKIEMLILKQVGFSDKTLYEIFNNENEILQIIYNKNHPFYNKYYEIFSGKEKELSRDFNNVLNIMDDFNEKMKEYKKKGIKILYRFSDSFPSYMFDKGKIPPFLYCYGNLKLLDSEIKKVSIIGTRKPSLESEEKAREYTKFYIQKGYTTVSGLALGIDTIVHEETLINNGNTISVLPCSFEKIYPKENEQLFYEIIKKDGLILSTLGPFENSYKSSFLERNTLVANICDELFMVEATMKSGSLNTVRKASNKRKRILYDSSLISKDVIDYVENLGAIDIIEKDC